MSKKLTMIFNFLMLTIGLVQLVLGPILDFVMRDFALDKAQAGLVSMTYMLGNVPGMLLSNRKLSLKGIRLSSFLLALALGLMAGAPEVWFFLIGLFFAGMAAGYLFTGMAALSTSFLPQEHKAATLSRLYAWLGIGVVLGPLYSSLWQQQGLWRPIPASYAIASLALGIFLAGEESPAPAQQAESSFASSLGFWLICLGIFFYVGAESITSVWVVKFLLDEFQIPWSNFVLGGLWLNITLGRFILAKAHFPSLPTLVFLALWSTLCSFLAAFGSATVSVLSFLALGFGFSGIYSLLIDRGAALAGERAIGILGTAGVLGAASGSALAGFVAQSLDFPWGIAQAGFYTLGLVHAVMGSEKISRVERGENI